MANFEIFRHQFTANGNSPTQNIQSRPCSKVAVQVKGVGAAATAWTVTVDTSLDGTNFTALVTHNTATTDGVIVYAVDKPFSFYKLQMAGINLAPATAVDVYMVGMP